MNKNVQYTNYSKQISIKEKNYDAHLINNHFNNKHRDNEILDERRIIAPSVRNQFGEQNCFLNVLIHAVYNIKEIRKFFLSEEFSKDLRFDLYTKFQNIIEKYFKITSFSYKSNDITIDPIELRRELAELYQEEQKFQMNKMNDPVDLFLAILNSFHSYSHNSKSLKYVIDKPCNPQCLSHNLFWINILEQFQCLCGATSEVLQYDYNYFMYEVYVQEIFKHAKDKEDYFKCIFKFLKEINCKTSMSCPEKCRVNRVKRNFFLLSDPSYLCFNLIWTGKNPKLLDICKLFTMLPNRFNNEDLFNIGERSQSKTYELIGIVCYWSAHYVCFFKNEEEKYWIYYDDAIIIKVDSWKDLILKCLKSHFHPTILFYKIIDEKSSLELRIKDDLNPLFTKDEYNKLLANCQSIDEMNEKKSDYLSNSEMRKSLNLNKVRQSDSLKNSQITFSDNENKGEKKPHPNHESSHKETPSFMEIKDKENEKKVDNHVPTEDEWICQKEMCQNVNKLDTHVCLKCQGHNENIFLLNLQKKEYETNLKNSMKRRNSVDQIRLKSRSPLMDIKQEKTTISNNQIINTKVSPAEKPKENSFIICKFCNRENLSYHTSCIYCKKSLDNNSPSNKYSHSYLKDKLQNNNIYPKLSEIKDSQKYYTDINLKTNSVNKKEISNITNIELPKKEPWDCGNCRHLNKHHLNHCEKCHKDIQYVCRDKLIENNIRVHSQNDFFNYSQMNPISNINNTLIRRNTPVKKSENIKFYDTRNEVGKRSLNNDLTGAKHNIQRIFDEHLTSTNLHYKPVIKEVNRGSYNIMNPTLDKSNNIVKKFNTNMNNGSNSKKLH